MDLNLLEELERKAKRQKYLWMIDILQGYKSNIIEAAAHFEDGAAVYRSAYGCYAANWQGQSREAYELIAGELNQTANQVYSLGDDLVSEIGAEIRKLRRKVEALS
ncbi:DUF5082 domain-containing protein [Bacillus canaveralius]|uniref:DUF5082 domain-containing protein n=1 Tax=Bacillus canaveralius TaxID=1403243 RepID=A0A2N5GI59_9BACI|nr:MULTISPECIES: DUF5082 domain-containing protein [Bacillus]PLR80583.1 DUF5082 domain-containing protein [Bacillus canaveralius]PLR87735.1 DUF5082 domain-containing protein [Bacillus sp. V33-4]PLR92531.1 DUF5082 domain-containing protein [Bacillus canaveralius]